jgi:hypothetical protein
MNWAALARNSVTGWMSRVGFTLGMVNLSAVRYSVGFTRRYHVQQSIRNNVSHIRTQRQRQRQRGRQATGNSTWAVSGRRSEHADALTRERPVALRSDRDDGTPSHRSGTPRRQAPARVAR